MDTSYAVKFTVIVNDLADTSMNHSAIPPAGQDAMDTSYAVKFTVIVNASERSHRSHSDHKESR
jgi:hypothetical protein